MKKYLAYAVIMIVLAGAALFVSEIREADEYTRHPESVQSGAVAVRPRTGEVFAKPGGDGPRSSAELAWILREKIALDVMERMVTGGIELDVYNDRVREYNRLSSNVEYRESDMAAAERAVQDKKGGIVRETVSETIALSMPLKTRNDGQANVVWRVQKYLALLGYYPGRINGEENEGTISAVKMFEIRSDAEESGKIDERLAGVLSEIWITRNTPAAAGLRP
jgi:hypothetical protein